MAIGCLQRALHLSTNDETIADVWYNIGHISLVGRWVEGIMYIHVYTIIFNMCTMVWYIYYCMVYIQLCFADCTIIGSRVAD